MSNYFESYSQSKRLYDLMSQKGINANQLSKEADISRSSISEYLSGKHVIGYFNACKLAKVLGCSPEYLIGSEGPETVYFKSEDVSFRLREFEIDALMRRLNAENMERLKAYAELLVKAQDADKQNDN